MQKYHEMIEAEHDGKKAVFFQKTLRRAKSRFERRSEIRRAVALTIDGVSYLFTENEVRQGFQNWLGIERLHADEIASKKNLILKLSRNRDTAFRLQAAQTAASSVQ